MEKTYRIQNPEYDFNTGFTGDGKQVLMGILMPELVLVEFDAQGNYLQIQMRSLPSEVFLATEPRYRIDEDAASPLLEGWQKELAYRPGTIQVHSFFLPEIWLGIKDLPEYLQEFVDDPESIGEDEREHFEEMLAEWRADESYVLWWGKDYFMGPEGDIEST